MGTKYLGIDVGGTNIKSIILNDDGVLLDKEIIPTEDSAANPEKWKQNIIDLMEQKTRQFAEGNAFLLECGISAPGLVDGDNQQILHMPDRLKGLENYIWSKELGRPVSVINDAHSACLAEYETYYKQNVKHMILLTLGTGVGGAVIINGQIHQGCIQRAGHLGHITIDHMGAPTMTNMVGSLEYAIGNFSVKERTHQKYESTKELVEAYQSGEPMATYWWLSSVQKLATGLASLVNAMSPELIVLGGGISDADEALFSPLEKFMELYEWRPDHFKTEIKKAQFGNFAGAVGAALFAQKKNN